MRGCVRLPQASGLHRRFSPGPTPVREERHPPPEVLVEAGLHISPECGDVLVLDFVDVPPEGALASDSPSPDCWWLAGGSEAIGFVPVVPIEDFTHATQLAVAHAILAEVGQADRGGLCGVGTPAFVFP